MGTDNPPVDTLRTTIQLAAPGDYAKSALLMSSADRAHYLKEKTNSFIGSVREKMTPAEIQSLPADTGGYINAIVSKSFDHVDSFHKDLADLVTAHYHLSPEGERYIYDPINKGALFTDENGELVTLVNADITTIPKGIQGEGRQVISRYDKAFVWTGPQAEKEFTPQEKPIPGEGTPVIPKPELLAGRKERTKISPRLKVDMLFQKIRSTHAEAGTPISPPADTKGFVDAHIKAALDKVDLFKGDLAETIAFLYHYRPEAERFFQDPNTGGTLFVDKDQNIVVLNDSEIATSGDGKLKYIRSYSTATALTGPEKGKSFTLEQKPLPPPPKPPRYAVLPSKT